MSAETTFSFLRSDVHRTHAMVELAPTFGAVPWTDLERAVSSLVAESQGKSNVRWVVDLTPLTQLNSSGMAFLLRLWKDLGLRPGSFALACPSNDVRETIATSGMGKHWTVGESREAVMRTLGLRMEEARSSGLFASPFRSNGNGAATAIAPAVPGASVGHEAATHAAEPSSLTRREPSALRHELLQILEIAGPAPFVDLLFDRALTLHATDVHFDPHEDGMHLRFRVDGLMHEIAILPMATAVQAISRIKLMAQMDITEKRLAQDGHIPDASKRHHADVRIGTGPTIHGERAVLRLMPDATTFVGLGDLGLTEDQQRRLEKSVAAPSGIMLFVGPVGSGKSTTTYTCLAMLNRPERSVVTIEDPVERRMHGVNQIQTDTRIEFGFAAALRGVLRQDPDVIMVGEIRDAETAHIAVRASMTGVRVLSTLHASDTSSAVDVLRQFDIPPMFISDSLNAVVAQRLVRKICGLQRETFTPDAGLGALLKLSPEAAGAMQLVRGVPADVNFFTGYNGRTGIYEVMTIGPEIRAAILSNQPSAVVFDLSRQHGMMTLEEAAIQKVLAGVTTIEEMLRVLTV